MTTANATDAIDRLSAAVDALLRAHDGRLCFLAVEVPAAVCDGVTEGLPPRLTAMGVDFVDLEVRPAEGVPRIAESRFDPGWA